MIPITECLENIIETYYSGEFKENVLFGMQMCLEELQEAGLVSNNNGMWEIVKK
ncbi:MAG: hypothetical protein H6Q68_2562 [Firmicutes bacterium]|nr:hypothetical protein [Bacillota bacterium]